MRVERNLWALGRRSLLIAMLAPAAMSLGLIYFDCNQASNITSLGYSTNSGYAVVFGFPTCYPTADSSCTACNAVFDPPGPDNYDVLHCADDTCEVYENWEEVPPDFGGDPGPPDQGN